MTSKILEVTDVKYIEHRTKPKSATILTVGTVPSTGWSNGRLIPWIYKTPPADGIQDFDFVADAPGPGTIVLQVVTPIGGYWYGVVPGWIKGIRIHASTNKLEASFGDEARKVSEGDILMGGEIPWPFVFDSLGDDVPWPIAIQVSNGDVPWPD